MKIEFRTTNAAFDEPYFSIEVCRILKDIANKVEDGYDTGFIFDLNGNQIGVWML